ncbi:MAG: TfoX/Sxy family protein [Bacteroidales bacterium]|nr:TfoX/Sxy family protein [Bacteroidales bacterium]
MASNPDFVQYIVDQCTGAGDIETRKMFGDYCVYCGGKPFGLVSDNGFYVKPTEAGRRLLRSVDLRPPYKGAKPYFYIEDVDDRDYLSALVKATCVELPAPKPKIKKQKKKS